MNRSAISAMIAVCIFISGCSDPKKVIVGHDFRAFIKEQDAVISALEPADQKLFRAFAAEYELTYSTPKARTPGVEMTWALGDKTIGQVLDIAREYYAKKEKIAADQAVAAQARLAAADARRQRAQQMELAQRKADSMAAEMAQARERQINRPGPKGESRIFASGRERDLLLKGEAPDYMHGQFRFYLVDLALVQPAESGCKRPLVAVKLAVENLHGEQVLGIRGSFSFNRALKKVKPQDPEMARVGIDYFATLVGPFIDVRSGGHVSYVTAYLDQSESFVDANYLNQILSVPPLERIIFFKPNKFFYPNGDSYTQEVGRGPDRGGNNGLFTCGGMGPDSAVHPAWQAALDAAKR